MSARTTAYYDATARAYDQMHGGDNNPEHIRALERAWPIVAEHSIKSVLDVGCGTGRSLRWLHRRQPSLKLLGVDPSRGLLEIAQRDLSEAILTIGSGEQLAFPDNSVDLVIATGIMHHVDSPTAVMSEMFRVARTAVLISDHNNFAFGSVMARRVRMALYTCGLLKIATYLKQGFNHQGYSEGDGWWYPYSLFNNHSDIARFSDKQYLIPTTTPNTDRMGNLLFTLSHFAVLAFKR